MRVHISALHHLFLDFVPSSQTKMDDTKYEQILEYLMTGEHPPMLDMEYARRKLEKRKLRAKASLYHLRNDTLVIKTHDRKMAKRHEVKAILETFHDNAFSGGHLGRDKTMYRIKQIYYWRGMKKEIEDYISRCEKCQFNNSRSLVPKPQLRPIPVPPGLWRGVTIDLIGPLNETKKGNRYICAITCHFSKWSEAEAIPNKEMVTVLQFLLKVIFRNGVMEQLDSDQGREFINICIEGLTAQLNIDHRASSAYHPQTHGQSERDNHTLKT